MKNYLSPDGVADATSCDSQVPDEYSANNTSHSATNTVQRFSILSKSGSNKHVNVSPDGNTSSTNGNASNVDPVIVKFLVEQVRQ